MPIAPPRSDWGFFRGAHAAQMRSPKAVAMIAWLDGLTEERTQAGVRALHQALVHD